MPGIAAEEDRFAPRAELVGMQNSVLAVAPTAALARDSITVMNFPNQDVYRIAVTIFHIQPENRRTEYRANYHLLAYDRDGALIGVASSGDVSIQGSHQILFPNPTNRPIRLAILEDDNLLEGSSASCGLVRECSGFNTPLLLERVELFTSP